MTASIPADFPAPSDYPELFYRAYIGGVPTPGVIPPGGISGWSLDTDYDVKKGKGADGATATDAGDPPPSGKIKVHLWRKGVNSSTGKDDPSVPHDFEEWDGYVKMLRAARRSKQALDIVHPIVNQLEVRSILVKKIGQLTDEGKGLWSAEIELMKWVDEPKDAGGTPAASQDKDASKPADDLDDGLDPSIKAAFDKNQPTRDEFEKTANEAFSDQANQ